VTGGRSPAPDADVLLVGYGPVGQVLSLLLAQRGWRVIVVEQWPTPYQMPRAVTFDGHAARIIAAAGAADVISQIGEPSADYVVENGTGQTLLRIGLRRAGRHGWPDSTSMYQPGLEAALAACGARQPSLQVLRGHRVVGLAEHGPLVEVMTRDVSTEKDSVLRARWVVGCDGANSCVRAHMGTTVRDFGFCIDWMACDVTPFRSSDFPPTNLQIADPVRPRVAVSAGHGHRRWEFMRLPGEPPEEFGTLANAWRRLAMFGVTPANATLDRHAVYTISARCADRWRAGRIIIAGDAAHQMPPFAGQGLCSGIRDAANLAWKLDLVLGGRQDGTLLDTYECERKTNVVRVIQLSVWLGSLICMAGQAEAAERDAVMLRSAGRRGDPPDIPDGLTSGLLHSEAGGMRAGYAGSLLPQARVTCDGRTGWFDEIAGSGFVLLAREDPATLVDHDLRDFLRSLGTRFVQVVPPGGIPAGPGGRAFLDVGHEYLRWLESMRALGVLVRPDFYLFGIGRDRAGVAAMVAGLRACLDPGRVLPKGDRCDFSRAPRCRAHPAEQRGRDLRDLLRGQTGRRLGDQRSTARVCAAGQRKRVPWSRPGLGLRER
jgi:flavoprotein hydroxylase